MKKFIIFFKLYWVQLLLGVVIACLLALTGVFIFHSIEMFLGLESFSRRTIMAQYGLLFIVFLMVHVFSMPLMFGMQYYFMQGGFAGKKKMDVAKVNVKWDDVIGMESAKKEASELVKLLKDRAMVKAIGGKIIKGTMMIGPPGCGKTYLAKAIATECGLPLLSAVGSEFVGMFVGQGTAQMKSLFRQARALAELHGGCIIFIDEIDSFARPRGADTGFGGGRLDMNSTINQFLTEMDGLRNAENSIAVIAATNVPAHELDSAIMRAGRFDRKITVTRPNLTEREDIFKFYLSRVKTEENIDAATMAKRTVGFTPAEIEATVREAGLFALRESRDVVTIKDLSAAYDRVSFGHKSNIVLTKREKEMTAYHEAGHAVIYYMCHPTDDVMKATIEPRGGALGFVFARPSEELHSHDREHLMANIKVFIASYVAEKRKFKTTTTGVGGSPSADFNIALRYAHDMVWRYGMGKSGLIGDFHALSTPYGGSYISEKTKEILDDDVQHIMQTCLKEVDKLLTERWDVLEHFAQELYEKGELEYNEIESIFTKFNVKPARKTIAE